MNKLYGTSRWKQMRLRQLYKQPLCVNCEARGITTPATVVDHIKPHHNNEALFWDETNLQSMCKRCHDGFKQRLEKTGIALHQHGCDASGFPVDARHHWNK